MLDGSNNEVCGKREYNLGSALGFAGVIEPSSIESFRLLHLLTVLIQIITVLDP